MNYVTITLCLLLGTAAMAAPTGDEPPQTYVSKEYVDEQTTIHYEYFEDGTIARQGVYFKNKKSGIWEQYFPNGDLKTVITYKKGKRHGETLVYSEDGLQYTLFYKKGKRIVLKETKKVKNQ